MIIFATDLQKMKAEQLLKRYGLSRTKVRMQVINLLALSDQPVSGNEILQKLHLGCNKSTIYRTINALYNKGLLARIIVDYEVKYTLKTNMTDGSAIPADHVHFKCNICNKVFCLKDLLIEDYELPEGFIKSENQFLIIGTCKTCSEQNKMKKK